jgi:hypothetical protein
VLGILVVLSFSRRSGPVHDLPAPARATPIEFLDALGSLYRNAGAASAAVAVALDRFRRRSLRSATTDGLHGKQAAAADLAAILRRRFPQADSSLEADLIACEEAAWGETISAREALKLIQKLHRHQQQLQAAAKPGSAQPDSKNIQSEKQERAS